MHRIIEDLKIQFCRRSLIDDNGGVLTFEGDLGNEERSLATIESLLKKRIPETISTFIKYFGGTRLYVDEYGLSLSILPPEEIIDHNLKVQETTEIFFPDYIIFGYASSGDLLILYTADGPLYFGVLDHEAWCAPEVWRNEAIEWFDFTHWLTLLIESKGNIA